jgi:VanZ family protein
MSASLVLPTFRVLTWFCVILLAVLSLLPAQEMLRTGLPSRLEHFVAYAGSAAVAMVGYGPSQGVVRIIGCFWLYGGILEYLQHFSPGRHPSIWDFAASALGALCGGLAVAVLLWRIEQAKAAVLLRHAGLAEAGDIGGFEQGVDLRHQSLVIFDGPQASEARKAVVTAQPAGLGEFGGGAFGLAGKRISGSELGADVRMCPIGVRAFSSQTTASFVRDCTKRTSPIWRYRTPMNGSRGLHRTACSSSEIGSSIDPMKNLQ